MSPLEKTCLLTRSYQGNTITSKQMHMEFTQL